MSLIKLACVAIVLATMVAEGSAEASPLLQMCKDLIPNLHVLADSQTKKEKASPYDIKETIIVISEILGRCRKEIGEDELAKIAEYKTIKEDRDKLEVALITAMDEDAKIGIASYKNPQKKA